MVERIDLEELASDIVALLTERIPSYSRLPPPIRGEVASITRWLVEVTVESFAAGAPPDDASLERVSRSARDRHAEGLPLEDLLQAYRLGSELVWRRVLAAVEPGEEDVIGPFGTYYVQLVGRFTDGILRAYLDERDRAASERERRLRHLFDALCTMGPISADTRAFAESLRLPIEGPFHPFALALPPDRRRRLPEVAADLRELAVLAVVEGGRVVGLSPRERLHVSGLPDGHLLVLADATDRVDLPAVLDDVRAAVDVGERLGRTGRWPLALLVPEVLVAARPGTTRALRRALIEPLERSLERRNAADLRLTVEAYLAHGLDRAATARALHIHPNTLDRRLDRVEAVCGVRLGDLDDLTRLHLALVADRLGI
ncbi:MAG TPA: helix-turn-helix domain-containing protein [Acidimicrobiales bacterium]